MATEQQIKSFILRVAPYAQKAYKIVGKIKPSVCIAMGCVEGAYGLAGSCKHNSFFGVKVGSGKTATKYWDGKFFSSKTKEEYTVGTHTTITSAFRAYNSLEQAVFNYYELLNTSLYHRVTDCNYKEQMKQIKQCGYMTSSTEVNSVIKIIEKYNLTQYDYPIGETSSTKKDTVIKFDVDHNPFLEPKINITLGSTGEGALWVNWFLWRFGLIAKDKVVDRIDSNAYEAIKRAQQRLSIDSDGIVGAVSRARFKQTLDIR